MPHHAYKLYFDLNAQRKLTERLASEMETLKRNFFGVKNKLVATEIRFKETSHQLDNVKDLLDREQRQSSGQKVCP